MARWRHLGAMALALACGFEAALPSAGSTAIDESDLTAVDGTPTTTTTSADDPGVGTRGGGGETSTAPSDASGSSSGGVDVPTLFVDVTAEVGLAIDHGPASIPPHCLVDDVRQPGAGEHCLAERGLGGVSVGDYDDDGWPDVYLASLVGAGHLMHNRGDGTFEDVTAALGIVGPTASAAGGFADIDRDGDLDLAIVGFASARDYLFVNDGNGGFVEDAVARGFAGETGHPHIGTSIAFGDYDLDGWVDAFIGDWRHDAVMGHMHSHARLLHNVGDGVFEDVTAQMGVDVRARVPLIPEEPGVFVFAPAFVDLDDDGWPELVLAADFQTTLLLWNEGGTAFVERTLASGVGGDRHGMGSTFGDIDGDGDLDWFITAILNSSHPDWGNRLYRNEGGRTFTDVTDLYGVRDGGWGWGAAMFDHDNDGDLEIVMTAGWPASTFTGDPMRLFESAGDNGAWIDRAPELGLDLTGWGRGLVVLDHDRDGDLDVLVGSYSEPPVLYRNDTPARGWLAVRAIGEASNRDGFGARVRVQVERDGPWSVREIGVGSHLMGHGEALAHFGIGDADEVHRVEIAWPASGREQVLGPVAGDQILVVHEPGG